MFFFFYLVLRLIKESQQQHGLRHEDYQRYRSYCSRRVKRLRKTLHVAQGMLNTKKKYLRKKNKRKIYFIVGDRRHFKKKDITPTFLESKQIDIRYLHIPLMMAERAWAYAMQVLLFKLKSASIETFINLLIISAPTRVKYRASETFPFDFEITESCYLC